MPIFVERSIQKQSRYWGVGRWFPVRYSLVESQSEQEGEWVWLGEEYLWLIKPARIWVWGRRWFSSGSDETLLS